LIKKGAGFASVKNPIHDGLIAEEILQQMNSGIPFIYQAQM